MSTETGTSCGFVALIGAPNAGKSTLLNALVGVKISIVSHKVQTTRMLVRGIAVEGQSQIIFVDTPGIFAPKRRLDRAMVASAWSGAGDADVIALLVDVKRAHDDDTLAILDGLATQKRNKVLILNKIDTMEAHTLLEISSALNARAQFSSTFMVSALRGYGLADMRTKLATMMAPGPWLYPEDQVSDAPLRLLASEITREKMFLRLHDELPYRSHVETDSWKQLPDGSARIEQTIFVERDGHKKIVIGEAGRTLKAIGSAARRDIAEAAECPVHLFLHVKVRANWADDPARYREMGLEFPKGGS